MPVADLLALGYILNANPALAAEVVLTCDVPLHVDRACGKCCLIALHNDGLAFRQRRAAPGVVLAGGEWLIFDDYQEHAMEPTKTTPEHGVFVGLSVPLLPISQLHRPGRRRRAQRAP